MKKLALRAIKKFCEDPFFYSLFFVAIAGLLLCGSLQNAERHANAELGGMGFVSGLKTIVLTDADGRKYYYDLRSW